MAEPSCLTKLSAMAECGCLTKLITSVWTCHTSSGLGCLGDKEEILALASFTMHQPRSCMRVNRTVVSCPSNSPVLPTLHHMSAMKTLLPASYLHMSNPGRHHLECDTSMLPENVNQKCSKSESLNSLKCLHYTFPIARLRHFLVWV